MSVDQVIKSFYFQWLRTVMTNLLLKGLHKQSKSRVNSEEWQCSYKTSVNLYLVGFSMSRRFLFIFYVVSFLFHQISFYYTHCVQIVFVMNLKKFLFLSLYWSSVVINGIMRFMEILLCIFVVIPFLSQCVLSFYFFSLQ